jgi:hypothetical protein
MEPTPDTLDPRQAATLLGTTNQQARRRLEPYPPWLTATRAALALAGSGAIWLAVRGQHPYRGPSVALAVLVVLAFVAVNFAVTMAVARHATAGVSGRSRLRPAEIAVMTVAWIGVYAAMGVLAGTGASRAFVYGLYPTTVPLIVVGLAWAAIMAARASWRRCGTGLAIAVVGAVGLLAGPVGAWAVAGVGVCVVLLAIAVTRAWQQHRGTVRL